MRIVPLASILFSLAFFAANAAGQTSLAPAIEDALPRMAHVSVFFQSGGGGSLVRVQRSSSGFMVGSRGLLLTNEHLVDEIPTGGGELGGEYWLMVLIGGGRECSAKVIARDERLDLALLQVDLEEGELTPAVELASGPPPAAGSAAFVLGWPSAGHQFALDGVVSCPNGPVGLRQGTLQPDELLITDLAPLDDVDGGPVIDRSGRVIGIMNTVQRLPYDRKAEAAGAGNTVDYAVVLRADVIRKAFPEQLGAAGEASAGSEEPTAAMVRVGSRSVVSVWAGSDDTRPKHSAPNDPCGRKPEKGLGSGVIVDSTGLVLTSTDVIGEEKEVGIRLIDGKNYRGKVLRAISDKHLALIQVDLQEGTSLPAIELGSSDTALPGEIIAVIGNPYGATATVSAGVLAGGEVEERLRVGAWVHPGDKGGALIDLSGRLIGILVADILEGKERGYGESYLGVALPIDRVRSWLAAELEAHALAPGLRAAPAETEKDKAGRRNKVTDIVVATRESLLNIEVKSEEKRAPTFDPFATQGSFKLLGGGSGVVIDASGLAITNWHVVHPTLGEDGAQRSDFALEVSLPSGRRFPAHVLATSRDDDLALIQLDLPEGESVQPVPMGVSRPLRRGDPVVAIGNPYLKANTVTLGIVAAKDQDANIGGRLHPYPNMLQTDATINPGNSGGALLDIEGRLIGINSAGRSGVSLAIPVERVREVFGQKLLATMGPYLGLAIEDSTEKGVVVRAVEAHSPGAAAGIVKGDRVRAIDGRAVPNATEFGNALLAKRTAATMKFELVRDSQDVAVELHPITQAAWRVFRQTGIELQQVDYASDAELVRAASVAVHRAYTGRSDEPSQLMGGALRVVQAERRGKQALELQVGDLLLGAKSIESTLDTDQSRLVPFQSMRALSSFIEPLASREGSPIECWLYRDGKIVTARLLAVHVY